MADNDYFPNQDNQGGDWKKGLEGSPIPQIIVPDRDDQLGREGQPIPQIIPDKKTGE